jgi:hypothetical protein
MNETGMNRHHMTLALLLVAGLFAVSFLCSGSGLAQEIALPWHEGSVVSEPWKVTQTEHHSGYIRWTLTDGHGSSVIEVIKRDPGRPDWSTRRYTIQPGPGSDGDEALLSAALADLKRWEAGPSHVPIFGGEEGSREALDGILAMNSDDWNRLGWGWTGLWLLSGLLLLPLIRRWKAASTRPSSETKELKPDASCMAGPGAGPTTKMLVVAWIVVVCANLATIFIYLGPRHPDEFFQYLEQPFRILSGYGFPVWEFIRGTRNWTFPGLLLGIMAGCDSLGIDDPLHQLYVIRLLEKLLFLIALHLAAGGVRTRAGPAWAAAAVLILGLFPPILFETNRTMSEPWAMVMLLAAWGAAQQGRETRQLQAALLVGLATVFRLQVAITMPAFLLAASIPLRPTRPALIRAGRWVWCFCLPITLAAWLDWFTYGTFGSFVHQNLAAHFEAAGGLMHLTEATHWTYFLTEGAQRIGPIFPLALVAAVGLVVARRNALAGGAALLIIIAHSIIPVRTMRFILPAVPLFMLALLLAAAELRRFLSRLSFKIFAGVLVACLAGSVVVSGAHFGSRSELAGRTLATRHLGTLPALRSFCTVSVHRFETGGYFMLRRDVPNHMYATFNDLEPEGAAERCNYILTHTDAWETNEPEARSLGLNPLWEYRGSIILRFIE